MIQAMTHTMTRALIRAMHRDVSGRLPRAMLCGAALTLVPAVAAGQAAVMAAAPPAPGAWQSGQSTPPRPPVPPTAPVPPPASVVPAVPVSPAPPAIVYRGSDLESYGLLAGHLDLARLQAEYGYLQHSADYVALGDLQGTLSVSGQFLEGNNYRSGLSLIDRGQYQQAIERFDRVITEKKQSVDGAHYWKAFAQYKLGRTDEALATIAQLRRDYASSAYLTDARVLEADVRRRAGQPIDLASANADQEILLYAITGLMNSDPARAVPLISDLLGKTNSMRIKSRALYVLALSDRPEGHQILLNYAKGGGNPDLQRSAIEYLAASRKTTTTSADLLEIYRATSDPAVKMTIISVLGGGRNTFGETLWAASALAGHEPVFASQAAPGANGRARNLISPQELWTLYQREESRDLRTQMVSAFSAMAAVDQLAQVARTDREPAVRQRAIRSLGAQKAERTGTLLVEIYTPELDRDSKNSVITALGSQNNAEALVAIARKETNIQLRAAIVSKLVSLAPKSKVAADYLEEIIRSGR
jgi:TolA-binding protein